MIFTKGFLTIGRSENCSIKFDPLTEKIASKQHAFIEAKPDGFYIMDNGSTNGTFVNGQKVQSAKLNAGDTIQFGSNGVTALVEVDSQPSPTNDPTVQYASSNIQPTEQYNAQEVSASEPAREAAFGQFQMPQFDQEINPSLEMRNSITNLGLGNINVVQPAENRTGKYIGIAVTLFAIVFLGLIVTGIMLLSFETDCSFHCGYRCFYSRDILFIAVYLA